MRDRPRGLSFPCGLLDAGAEPVDLGERRRHERSSGSELEPVGFGIAQR